MANFVKEMKPSTEKDVESALQRSVFLFERRRYEQSIIAARNGLSHAKNLDCEDEKLADLSKAKCLTRIGASQTALERYEEAIQTMREAVQLCPRNADALRGLAFVLSENDPLHFPEALKLLREAHDLEPTNFNVLSTLATLLTNIGVRLKSGGLPAAAIENYENAVKILPSHGQAYYNLGVAYSEHGFIDKAINCYKKCIETFPSHTEAWCNLGVIHKNAGRIREAMDCYNKSLSSNPNFELAKRNLAVSLCDSGRSLKDSGDRKSAAACYKRAIALWPDHADAHYHLGVLYSETGKLERALASYSLAVQFNEKFAEAQNNLGVVHKDLGNLDKAMECYQKALDMNDDHVQTHNNIGVGYTLMGNTDLASFHLNKCIELSPSYSEATNNLGVLLRDYGDIDGAISRYEQCYRLDPRADMAAQNRLHALNYSDFWTKEDVYLEHKKWGDAYQSRVDGEVAAFVKKNPSNALAATVLKYATEPPRPCPTIPRGPGTDRPLRVAYLSPDFFTHSVSYFAEVLLANHSSDAVTVFAYANVARQDAKTERLRNYPCVKDRWKDIWGKTSVEVAEMILEDKIDILVELAGHTANNRMDVMALRLAPIQITWIGYPNTTGLPSIHYRVVDGQVDPVGTTQKFSEKLWRLPETFLCYTPATDAPDTTSPPPSESSGGIITFGSFNVLAKLQPRTIKVWSRILTRVPDSRLLIKAKPLGSKKAKDRLESQFKSYGINAGRLDLVPLIPANKSHLQAYANMDVGLDPFPYAGTTTTCEALYMGVPVITMGVKPKDGDHAMNVGATLLSTIGHEELIAHTEDEYVEKAVELALDVERLKKVRANLRSDMMNSPLGQGERYVKHVEQMYCDMWVERGGTTKEDQESKLTSSQETDGVESQQRPLFVAQDTPVAV